MINVKFQDKHGLWEYKEISPQKDKLEARAEKETWQTLEAYIRTSRAEKRGYDSTLLELCALINFRHYSRHAYFSMVFTRLQDELAKEIWSLVLTLNYVLLDPWKGYVGRPFIRFSPKSIQHFLHLSFVFF